jgi:hypothetical protein
VRRGFPAEQFWPTFSVGGLVKLCFSCAHVLHLFAALSRIWRDECAPLFPASMRTPQWLTQFMQLNCLFHGPREDYIQLK